MVDSRLLDNIANFRIMNPAEAYEKGAASELLKKIKETDLEKFKFNNVQAPIIAKERADVVKSNLESAEVNRDFNTTQKDKMIQDIFHGKTDFEVKDAFVSLDIASTLPYDDQTIFIKNLKEKFKGNGRASAVLGYLELAPLEGRAKVFKEVNDAGIQGGYLEKLNSGSFKSITDLTAYVTRADEQKKLDQIAEGLEPTGLTPGEKNEKFLEAKRAQQKEKHDTSFGSKTGTIDAELTDKADELRDTEEIAESNKASSVDQAKQTVKDIASIHESISTTTSTIDNLTGIEEAIEDRAITGWASKFAPSLRAATLKLQNHAHRLGLDVIASVTFGALSEAELRLAMETAVPTDMKPQDLKKWVIAKKAAMKKFLREQQKMVIFLSNINENTGVRNTKTDWLVRNQKLRDKEANNPNNPNVKKPNQPKTKPTQQHLNYYYTNPKNLSQEKLDRFFMDKFGKLPPTREVI